MLFELISQRYERGATLITSNLPFDEWTETFGSERLTGALLDRLTHHVNILEMNGDSYRLAQSRGRKGIAINQGRKPGSGQIGPRGPKRPGTRQLYRERRHLGALRIPGARFRHPQVANICSATWPVFAPPLTSGFVWMNFCREVLLMIHS